MRQVLIIARHDLLITLKDRRAVLWMFLLPVVFATFFGLVTADDSSASPSDPKARLSVVDEDGSAASRALISELASERLDIVEVDAQERASATDLVRTLVIPEGFGEQVLAGMQVKLRLEKESGSSPEAALVTQARITAAIARLLSRLIEDDQHRTPSTPRNQDVLITAQDQPDLVVVQSRFAGRAIKPPSGFSHSVPGMAVMFVLLVALTYGAASLAAERRDGKLYRLASAPVSVNQIIIGKILGRIVVAWTQVSVLVAIAALAHLVFSIALGNLFLLWLVLLAFALSVAPLGVVFGAVFADPDRAASLGAITTMAFAALGGCWWPIEIVSPALQRLSLALPTGWAMQALHGVVSFGAGPAQLGMALLVLCGFSLGLSVIATKSLNLR